MKRIIGFFIGLGFLSSLQPAEAQSSICTLKVASMAARLVGGAGVQDLTNGLRRGQIVTNIMGDKTDAYGNTVYKVELLDGRDSRFSSAVLSSGEITMSRSNKVIAVRFNPNGYDFGGTGNNSTKLVVLATDAALALYNLNRPDVGSQIEVNIGNSSSDWVEMLISDRQNSSWVQKVVVRFDHRLKNPILSVEMGQGWWETDQGLQQVASSAARMVGGASLNHRGVRRGNLVTSMNSRDANGPIQSAQLLNGTNAQGAGLANVTVRFDYTDRAIVDQVDIQSLQPNLAPRPYNQNEVLGFVLDAVLGLYNINRVDAARGTYATAPRFVGRNQIGSTSVNLYQMDVMSPGTGSNPEQRFSYVVAINEHMFDPILRVERLN